MEPPSSIDALIERYRRVYPDLSDVLGSGAYRTVIDLYDFLERQQKPPTELLTVLSEHLSVPFQSELRSWTASPRFCETIPIAFARRHHTVGLLDPTGRFHIVLGDPRGFGVLDTLYREFGLETPLQFAAPAAVLTAINFAYQQRSGQSEVLVQKIEGTDVRAQLEGLEQRPDLLSSADQAPVVQLVNSLLFEAIQQRASDIHLQPVDGQLVVRLRIDGVLFDFLTVPQQLQEEIVSRVKVTAKMNIAEKRLPQDGRATVQLGDRIIDLRIASMPTSLGEKVVIRLLDKSARLYTLDELGMDGDTRKQFEELIRLEHGLILVTGPTGSGKSTSLYAALQEINSKDRNVVTLEDPIEYHLDGVSQTQINTKKGMTFASGLRSVLRQDPDIIMVGEIRDHETAEMAIQSALTGHLVFSTLHTNDAASAVTRLLDLQIEPYLVSSSVVAVLAQRLVRRICPKCKNLIDLNPQDVRRLPFAREPEQLWRGLGCEHCRQTGYFERIGIFELLSIEDDIRKLVQVRESAAVLREAALANGMHLLRDDGMEKICRGETTIDEIVRVTVRSAN